MRKIVISGSAGMAGTDFYEFWEIPDDVTDEELSDFAWDCGRSNAEMYGIYPRHEYEDDEDVDTDKDCYSDNIEGWWEDYDPKLHDGHRIGNEIYWNQY